MKILRRSNNRVIVADGHIIHREHKVDLPFDELSTSARKSDTFNQFEESLRVLVRSTTTETYPFSRKTTSQSTTKKASSLPAKASPF